MLIEARHLPWLLPFHLVFQLGTALVLGGGVAAGQKALLGLAVLSVMKNRNKTAAGNEFEADNRQPLAPVSSRESCTPETWLREAFFANSLPYQEVPQGEPYGPGWQMVLPQ